MTKFSTTETDILNSVSDGITINSQEIILYVNSPFAKMVGYSVEELIGMNILDVTAPEYSEIIQERTHNRQQGIETVSLYEVELVRKDGSRFPVEYSVSHLEYNGKSSSLTIIRDISQRTESNRELQIREDTIHGFMNPSTGIFALFDHNMNYTEIDETWFNESDKSRTEIIGKNLLDVYPQIVETGRYDDYLQVIETGIPVTYYAVDSVSRPGVLHDLTGFKVGTGLGLVNRNVTDEVKYRRQLQALNEHSTLLDYQNTIEEVIAVTFQIIKDLFGYNYGSFGIVEGESIHHILVTQVENVDEFNQPLNGMGVCPRAVRSGVTQVVNDTREDPDFSIAVAQDIYEPRSEVVVPISIEGKIGAVLNVESLYTASFSDNDVKLIELLGNHIGSSLTRIIETEKRVSSEQQLWHARIEREHEQELSRLKTRFMSTATHELRTPMASILGYSELIQDTRNSLSEDQKKYFDVIKRNVERLSKLTDDLLVQQRIEEGQTPMSKEQVKLCDMLVEVRNEFDPILGQKHQILEINCIDRSLYLDRLRITQVLINMLSNASKFSSENSIIVVEVVEINDMIRFSVSDDGIGLDEEDIGKLFSPFPGILIEGNVWGTGLGLSICRGIVELHGGDIWVESTGRGKGSTFFFSIPINH